MQFIHYKEFPPINLSKVGTIGKENQRVTEEATIYAIGFYEFERKLGYWVFQSQGERDKVFEIIKKQVSKDLSVKEPVVAPKSPAFVRS